jgi:hypothetical protein
MPAYVVDKVRDALNDQGNPVKGSKITLLGMAYKRAVDDPRESPGAPGQSSPALRSPLRGGVFQDRHSDCRVGPPPGALCGRSRRSTGSLRSTLALPDPCRLGRHVKQVDG